MTSAPSVALAEPRDDIEDAHAAAMVQFYDLELERSVRTLDGALEQAYAHGLEDDPAIAPILLLRGALVYSQTADEARTMDDFREAVRVDPHVRLPLELRSDALQALLEDARDQVAPTPSAAPVVAPGVGKAHGDRLAAPRWPRLYIDLGIGTGVGISHGTVEMTYEQYNPNESYGPAERACAIARWAAGDSGLAANATELESILTSAQIPLHDPEGLDAYDPAACAKRRSFDTGTASALMHLTPEIKVRIHERKLGPRRSLALLVGVFGRLQVLTGSRVYSLEPGPVDLLAYDRVRSFKPNAIRRRHGFTWAAGAKVQALIARRGSKLHGMVGLFGGYGHSRLRIDMRISNDRNGNSVPDQVESAHSKHDDRVSGVGCTPVWPYEAGCQSGSDGMLDAKTAEDVRKSRPDGDRLIDTMRLGPAFAGVLFGAHYQHSRHFGLYGEVDLGAWFPDRGSVLLDINFGPSLTF